MADKKDNGLQDVILELMISNETLGRIDKSLVTLSTQDSKASGPAPRRRATKREIEDSKMLNLIFSKLFDIDFMFRTAIPRFEKNDRLLLNDTNQIWETMDELLQFFKDGKLQAMEDRKEFIALLRELTASRKQEKQLAKKTPEAPKLEPPGRGFWSTVFDWAKLIGPILAQIAGAAGAMLLGFGLSAIKSIGGIFGSIIKGFASLGKRVLKLFGADTKIAEWAAKISEFFKPVTNWFRDIYTWFVKDGGAMVKAIEETGGFFGDIIKWVKNIGSKFFRLGELLGKLAGPLLILFTAYDTVVALIDAYKSGKGIGDIISAGLTGMLDSLIAAPLDLVKDAVAWILNKLQFKDAANILRGFSFSGLLTEFIDRLVTWGRNVFSVFFTEIFDAIDNISKGFTSGGVLNGLKKTLESFIHMMYVAPLKMLGKAGAWVLNKIGLSDLSKSVKDMTIGMSAKADSALGFESTQAVEFKGKNEGKTFLEGATANDQDKKDRAVAEISRKDTEKKIKEALEVSPEKTGRSLYETQSETDMLNGVSLLPIPIGGGGAVNTSTTNNNSSSVFNMNGMLDRTDITAKPAFGF